MTQTPEHIKYSDFFCQCLKEAGYTHCFTLQGANIMHLINSAGKYFTVVPVVNEVAAGMAAEYFNMTSETGKAFALVTAGPGFTNIVTAIAGAFVESRELLVIGGQVKTTDLSHGALRQRGIQEIDSVAIAKPITKLSQRFLKPENSSVIFNAVNTAAHPRKGPVFIDIPLDVQGVSVSVQEYKDCEYSFTNKLTTPTEEEISFIVEHINQAKRPVMLIGGGVSKEAALEIAESLKLDSIPIMLTWNAKDKIESSHPLYFGRPDTWGQRYANIIIQQADLLIAVGAKLSMQQTGFNYQHFIANGKIIQIDCDSAEINKGHAKIYKGFTFDANSFLSSIKHRSLGNHSDWINFAKEVRAKLPCNEKHHNQTRDGYISPFDFFETLSGLAQEGESIMPCSSGGATVVAHHVFRQKKGQTLVSNKALASMGHGLSGAIGAAIAKPQVRTILVEGDGGFSQNMQEIGTVAINNLNLKMFIFDDNGYASIRMTQRNYFGGNYLACDNKTGVGLPQWQKLFDAYNIPSMVITNGFENDPKFLELFNSKTPAAFIVSIDPEQTYFPKITSRTLPSGGMESNPLHMMTPELPPELMDEVFKFGG